MSIPIFTAQCTFHMHYLLQICMGKSIIGKVRTLQKIKFKKKDPQSNTISACKSGANINVSEGIAY